MTNPWGITDEQYAAARAIMSEPLERSPYLDDPLRTEAEAVQDRARSFRERMEQHPNREAIQAGRLFVLKGLNMAWAHNLRTGGQQCERDALEELAFELDLINQPDIEMPEPEEKTGMDLNDIYHGENIKAADLKGRDVTVTITDVQAIDLKERDGNMKRRLSIGFQGSERRLVLNVINANTIGALHGATNLQQNWPGKQITLYPTKTQFGNDIVDCIRIREQMPQRRAAPTQQPNDTHPNTPADWQAPDQSTRPVGGMGAQAEAEPNFGQQLDDEIPF